MSKTESVGAPPEWMNEEAKAVWLFLAEELEDELMSRDRPAFTAMCSEYGKYEAAAKDVHTRGVLVKGRTTDRKVRDRDEEGEPLPGMVKNPAIQVARDALTQFLQYAKDFGLTPGARKRMAMDPSRKKKAGESFGDVIDG